jgi:HEAT repeat protein
MVYKPIVRRPAVPNVEKTTAGLLQDAVATFSKNPAGAISAIRRLHDKDPSGVALAAARIVLSTEQKLSGVQYLRKLVTAGSLLSDLLLNPSVIPLAAAVPLARKLAGAEPLLDSHLLRNAAATARGDLRSTDAVTALRVLELVDAISDCTRLGSYLIQFVGHRNNKVRSKAALLLGRCNWNHNRVEASLSSDEGRERANALEALWGLDHENIIRLLWDATQDPCGRVVVNALLGLCKAGEREAYLRLGELAGAEDPVLRAGAAWAMGKTGDPQFGEALEKLEKDENHKVQAMAQKSLQELRTTPAEPPLALEAPASSDLASEEEPPAPAPSPISYLRIS